MALPNNAGWLHLLGGRGKKQGQGPRRRPRRLWFEVLEDRTLPAVVHWTNPLGGLWGVASNWSTGLLPNAGDDVVIDRPVGGAITHSSGMTTINSLTAPMGTLVLSGGSLSLASASSISQAFTLTGGTLTGPGTVTVTGALTWTGGAMAGAGRTVLAAGASGAIAGTGLKTLSRALDNAGALAYTGAGLSFGSGGSPPGVLTNRAGATFTAQGDGDVGVGAANPGHAFNNQGTFVRAGVGTTAFAVAFHNQGSSVEVREGTLDLQGGGTAQFDGTDRFTTQPGTTVVFRTSLTGRTTNGDQFTPDGTVVFQGGGAAAPHRLEVMGRDFGNVAAGFDRNFSYGTLQLTSAYVRLVDESDNAPGAGAEALYIDTLIVPAGSTLDLNLFRVYARVTQIQGTVLGGTVNAAPDGGPIALNAPAPGSIALAGEADEWTFFGRAGQAVSVLGNPGGSTPPPVAPALGRIDVRVLAPDGTPLAAGASAAAGQVVTLLGVALPADGVYRVRVRAADSDLSARGNYLLSVFNATIDTRPLVLNQQALGTMETAYSVDRWTFAADANGQVRLDVVNAAVNGLRFRLSGPDGWVGFADQAGDSELVNLSAAGAYVLEAYSLGAGAGSYSFRLDETTQTPLALGVTYAGNLPGSGAAQLFRLEVPQGNPLFLDFDGARAGDRTEVYARLGSPPTRRDFQYRNAQPGADHLVQIPFAAPGTWYVLVYGESVPAPSSFTLRAQSAPLILRGVTPDRSAGNQTATVTVRGAGFLPGSGVALVAADGKPYNAGSVSIDAFDQITAVFDLAAVPAGSYGVRVTLPGGTADTLPVAFQVLPAGQANLQTRLILPSAFGRNTTATLYLEYANTGTAALPAPVLLLQSADADGSDRPLLTLDANRVVSGLWTSAALPDGFGNSVQVYASGATPGTLQPGETVRVPVYYVGLQQPWDTSDNVVEFEIRVSEVGDAAPIDWAALRTSLRPAGVAADVWDAVFSNLVAQVGPTWGDYVRVLGDNAAYLGRLGLRVTDVNQLYGFEMQQALGLNPVRTLAAATDASLPTPGLALTFGRTFGNTIAERYRVGPFGRGWSAPWQVRLERLADGTAVVRDSDDSQRRFLPDSRRTGAFFSQAGDTGMLQAVSGGAYELTEANGLVTRFRADGSLEYVQDVNGNRITAGYTGGRLTSLTHSSGSSLAINYNGAGLIDRITDSTGWATAYGYDPTNTYLRTVTTPTGTTTYTYSTGAGAAREHALLSVTVPGGAARFFDYDPRGRLTASYRNGNAERVTYTYDTAGRVTATDAAGVATGLFFDHRGLVARSEDGLGVYTRYEHNDARQLVRETDALGRSRSYTWCGCGQLRTATDEHGRTVTFTPGGPNNRPAAFTDARGNTTRYGYDAAGNPESAAYADGSLERTAYNAVGSPIRVVNRRGQGIDLTPNAAGQVTRQTYPDGSSIEYRFDARGNLERAIDASGETVLEYLDPLHPDDVTKIRYPDGRFLEYAYENGRRTRMADQDGVALTYHYDPAGRLEYLRDGSGGLIVQYRYDAAGRLEREDKGNGTYTVYTYDGAGQAETVTHHAPGGAVNARFVYGYDARGRRDRVTTPDGEWTYTYDLTGQLTRAVLASANPAIPDQDLNYEYDAAGNRTRTVLNGATTDYAANGLNQYTAAGATEYRYDRDGNLTEEIGPDGTRRYGYDIHNRLVQVMTPQGTWRYEYDAFGNRWAVVADGVRTEYLLDPYGLANVVAEFDATGTRVASYAHGLGLEAASGPGGWRYYDFDVLGSTAGISASAGSYVNRYAYEPFGETLLTTEAVANSFEYVGAFGVMNEGNGLHYMRARFYSSVQGRLTAQDPLRLASGDFNLYRYGNNAPTLWIDPSGLIPASIDIGRGIPEDHRYVDGIDLRHAAAACVLGQSGGPYLGRVLVLQP